MIHYLIDCEENTSDNRGECLGAVSIIQNGQKNLFIHKLVPAHNTLW